MIQLQVQLQQYINRHTSPPSKVLYELYRETHLKTLAPQMAAGPYQGKLLKMLSCMLQPKAILEIGTFTGYAAICLAQGLQTGGVVHTIEVNEELEDLIVKYLKKAGVADKVNLHIGDAKSIIPTLTTPFDLVYIDAGKRYNGHYYDLVFEQVKKGGFIIVDNVLWSGKVAEKKMDKDAARIDAFNKKVQADERVENILLPVRDGIMVVRKVEGSL